MRPFGPVRRSELVRVLRSADPEPAPGRHRAGAALPDPAASGHRPRHLGESLSSATLALTDGGSRAL